MTDLLGIEKAEPQTLEEVEARLAEIEAQVNAINSASETVLLKEIISNAKQEEDDLYAEFEAKLRAARQKRNDAQDQLNAYESELNELQRLIDALREMQGDFLKAIAAQEKLDQIRGTIEEIAKNFAWAEKLRPYQWDDLIHMVTAFMADRNGVLNANDMSLGKTFETVAMLDLLDHLFYSKYGRKPIVLWLTKKSLVGTTAREIAKWNPDRKVARIVKIVEKKQRELIAEMAIQSNATIVTNYDALNTTDILAATKWDVVVMDEVHKVKGGANHKPTAIFTNTKDVCKNAKFIMPLTGTPIVNHPKEMWSYLNIFDEEKFPNVRTFEREYCFGYGMKDEDGNPLFKVDWDRMISHALKDRVIRRSKAEANVDLPDKERIYRILEMEGEQAVHYQNLRVNFFTWLDEVGGKAISTPGILPQLTRLRQCAIYPGGIKYKDPLTGIVTVLDCNESVKLDEAVDICEQLLAAKEQVVIFSSQFNDPLYELSRRLETGFDARCELITGAESSDLDPIQQRFQQAETDILLINMKTGSEGLNLHKSPNDWPGGACHAIFLDLWWNPALNTQAEDRIHRPGQPDNCMNHILQCEPSVDQFIANILEEKEAMISGIMDDSRLRTGSDWKSMLEELI